MVPLARAARSSIAVSRDRREFDALIDHGLRNKADALPDVVTWNRAPSDRNLMLDIERVAIFHLPRMQHRNSWVAPSNQSSNLVVRTLAAYDDSSKSSVR